MPPPSSSTSAPAVEPDRDSLEQIAQLVTGTQEDFEDLTDGELTELIEDQLDQATPADPQEDPTPDEPVADPHENPAGYDDQGAMTLPFDQLYPELVENEQVAFDDETLLLKLPAHMDSTVTEAMADAGVAGLELLFELEDAAWYEAYLAAGTDAPAAVEALRAVDGILLVDYNYEVRTAGIGDYTEIPEHLLGNSRIQDQWYLGTCGIYSGMDTLTTPGGSSSVIVVQDALAMAHADCPNDYIFNLNVTMRCTNGMDPKDKADYITQGTVTLTVRSGKVLPSVISEDMTLTRDNLYIIPSGTVITKGTTVNVEPGTHIQFWTADPDEPYADTYMASLCVNGTLNINGTKEDPVYIYPSDLMSEYAVQMYARNGGELNMTWADVTNLIMYYNEGGSYSIGDGYITTADHCTFRMNYGDGHIRYRNLSDGTVRDQMSNSGMMTHFRLATNCVFYKMALTYGLDVRGTLDGCIFADSALNFYEVGYTVRNCVFLGNCMGIETWDRSAIATTLQIPVPGQLYYPNPMRTSHYPAWNMNLFACRQNSETTRQLMAELGYLSVTIDSDEMAQWLYDYAWDVLCGYASDFGSPEPAAGVTYEWLYAVPDLELTEEALNEMLLAAFDAPSTHPKFHGNVILNRISTDFDPNHWLRIEAPGGSGGEVPLGGNYWGTTDERAIGLQIVDYTDFPAAYSLLNYKPFLEVAPENTFPFVTDVTIFNKDGEEVTTVSNEEITVRVTFNRDMDISIPLSVQYGSATPFRDYTIEGEFTDARTWEGKKLLTTVIENGTQYFSISNGCSAEDDLILCADTARFFFELDTTAAQALIMQGEATAEGIRLTWSQDDFDTLMGYNVYRSDSEDGYYQRVNEITIPADTKTFFDDTVEPGMVYYYNFTVVKTDLSESVPSGKITIQALDTMAPNIYHTPVYTAKTGSNLVITATVTDNLAVSSAKLLYRIAGENTWHTAMMNGLNSKFTAIIPAAYITEAGLEYYIEASDGISITRRGSAENPYRVTVTVSQDVSSLGDVDGNGAISALDALLLLQHINDLVNLTAPQFERADLNADGRLTASEALRILQYVSGTIGSLTA